MLQGNTPLVTATACCYCDSHSLTCNDQAKALRLAYGPTATARPCILGQHSRLHHVSCLSSGLQDTSAVPLQHLLRVAEVFFGLNSGAGTLQGRLWAGDADHLYPGASDQQLHWQHQRECKRADGSCQLESVPG